MEQGWGELRTLYRGGDGTIKVGYYDIRAAMMAHHMLRKDSMDIRYATARDGIGREGEGVQGLGCQRARACKVARLCGFRSRRQVPLAPRHSLHGSTLGLCVPTLPSRRNPNRN